MQRVFAIVVGAAVLGAAGHLSRLHTHAYSGHAQPEHQHGLASHEHQQAVLDVAADDEGVPHVESGDAEQHTVSFTVGYASARTIIGFHADVTEAPSIALAPIVRAAADITDVRVHGPPATGVLPSRAPPPHFPA